MKNFIVKLQNNQYLVDPQDSRVNIDFPKQFSPNVKTINLYIDAFENTTKNFDLEVNDSSEDEIDLKAIEIIQQPPQQQQQLPLIQEREKTRTKAGILKPVSHEITEKPFKTMPQVNVPRKISTNKLFKVAELTAQTLDLELNNRFNTAKDKSILANQQATHYDSVRLSYLKRYVANGLSGKNGSKFHNGYWNRLPFKPKPLNVLEFSNTNETASTLTKTSVDISSNASVKLIKPVNVTQQQQQQQPINSLPSLQRELSIIDLHLPPTIQNQQPKTPMSYYKRNVLVYLNNKMDLKHQQQQQYHPLATNNFCQKSVTFNNTISVENYTVDPLPSVVQQQEARDLLSVSNQQQMFPANINGSFIDVNKVQVRYLNNGHFTPQSQAKYRANLEINGKRYYLSNLSDDTQKSFLQKGSNEFNSSNTSITTNEQTRRIKFA